MKLISFTALASLLLLVGCSSTKNLNGKYEVDKEYNAREIASRMAKHNDAPAEEFYGKYIKTAEAVNYDVEMVYPYLVVILSTPDNSPQVSVFKFKQVDKNNYIATDLSNPASETGKFVYNSSEGSLSSITTKYIKR